jgi:tetratricopeptide (TPR) repeat protein
MRWKTITFVLVACFSAAYLPYGLTDDGSLSFENGKALYQAGDMEQAAAAFRTAIACDPLNPQFRNALGNVFAEQRQFHEALSEFNNALKLDPKMVAAYVNRARVYQAKNDLPAAIRDFTSAIDLGLRDYDVFLRRAEASIRQGNSELARQDIDHVISLYPGESEVWAGSSQYWIHEGNYQKAEAHAASAVRLAPKSSYAHCCLAQVLRKQDRFQEALQTINHAISLHPDDPDLLVERAEVSLQIHEYDKAMSDCERAIELNGKHSRAFFVRGHIQQLLNQNVLAVASYTAAIHENNLDGMAIAERGYCHAKLLRHREAISDFSRAIELCPDLKGLYAARAESLFFLKETQSALNDCEASLREDPNSPAPYGIRGAIMADQGKYEAALRDLNHSISLGVPNADYIYYYRAIVRLILGLPKEAIADLEHCCAKNPECSQYHYAIAIVLSTHPEPAVRDSTKAIDHANRALALYQQSSGPKQDVHLLYEVMAAAYAEAGAFDQSRTIQVLAVDSCPSAWRSFAVDRLKHYEAGQPCREVVNPSTFRQSLVGNWPRP